jgi:hypothetical protein
MLINKKDEGLFEISSNFKIGQPKSFAKVMYEVKIVEINKKQNLIMSVLLI